MPANQGNATTTSNNDDQDDLHLHSRSCGGYRMSTTESTAHADAPDRDNSNTTEDPDREPATVGHTSDGDLQGVAVFLTGDDLRKLGMSRDVTAVVPRVFNGAILLEPVA